MSESVLEVRDLSLSYGGIVALDRVSLEVAETEIVAIVGANGAGKSSLIKAICGMARPSGGDILLRGRSLAGAPAHRRARAGIAAVPEHRRLFGGLSVTENLELGAYRLSRMGYVPDLAKRIQVVLDLFPRLAERRRQTAETMSGGEQQMLAIARALMAEPEVILADEPSIGLAPKIVEEIFAALARLRDQGTAILLVEQNAMASLEIAERAYVLERGVITMRGGAAELRQSDAIRGFYLGA